MTAQRYSDDELAWMKENRTLTTKEYHRKFQETFGRFVSIDAIKAKKKECGWRSGLPNCIDGKYKPVGFEFINRGGYLERKINDDFPARKRWRTVHRINWEAIHGPVPRDMVLKCKGDQLNTDPSNWELVPFGILGRLNGNCKHRMSYDSAPEHLKPTLLALAKLEHGLRSAELRKAAP